MVLRRFGRLDEIERVYRETGGGYVDAQGYARVECISVEEARQELYGAVAHGFLRRMFLVHASEDLPIPVLVEAADLGRSMRLADTGYVGDDMDREVVLSEWGATEVFVAR